MRYILARRGARKASERVREIMADEEKQGLKKLSTYQAFAGNVAQNKEDLLSLLKKIKSEGKRIVGYGATSKSTTVLNYCGIGPEYIEFISDTTPIKQGKFTPGMHIPVKPYDAFAVDYPEYALLFAWNHGEEIIANESSFQDAGGKFILYVDRVRVDE